MQIAELTYPRSDEKTGASLLRAALPLLLSGH